MDALPDGTRLAAAGGVIIERAAGKHSWTRSPFAPLGAPVDKLRGYRDAHGAPHALALARYGETAVLLDGDARGWRAVTDDARMAVSDFDLERGSRTTWIAGSHAGDAVVTRSHTNG